MRKKGRIIEDGRSTHLIIAGTVGINVDDLETRVGRVKRNLRCCVDGNRTRYLCAGCSRTAAAGKQAERVLRKHRRIKELNNVELTSKISSD